MANTVSTRYLYPPDWDGFYEDGPPPPRRYIAQITCVSDGTAETDLIKFAIGDFLTQQGIQATRFVIESIDCTMYGFTSVKLEFDRAPDSVIAVFGDSGYISFPGGLTDTEEGGTGNITVTTAGVDSGDNYDIRITFRVK